MMKQKRKTICLESRWLVQIDQMFTDAHFGAGRKKVRGLVEPSRWSREDCQEVIRQIEWYRG